MAALMGAFGLMVLALSSVGVYGVMAYVVSGQTHEIGIRMALGAPRATVLAMLFRRGMWTELAGLLAGLIPAFGLARLIRAVVSGASAVGPAIFAIPLVLAFAADRDLHSRAASAEDRSYRGTETGIAGQ
jgi:putative ABC transport system permease protein